MRKRDLRRQRLEHNRSHWQQAWAPIEDDPEGDESETDLDPYYVEPTGDDISYLEARRMYG